MQFFTGRKFMVNIFTVLAAVVLLTSCKKDKDDEPSSSYPKKVAVEYKITTTTSDLNSADVLFVNETGGFTSMDAASIPFSQKFDRTVNKYDDLSLTITASGNGSAKLEIIVDNKVVDTKTFSGTSIISGTSVYVFP